MSRNKRTSSPYSITSYNKANVSYEPISLSKSRNVQSRLKSPFHLYLESENSLSYTTYLKRAKEKPKENPINLKKKRNSLEEISRNINNIKKIEKKESFTHDNNNATTIISSTLREATLYFLQYKSMVMSPAIVPPVIASPPFHILNISATL